MAFSADVAQGLELGRICCRNSLRIKHLLINLWGSRICQEKSRNPMILKKRTRGEGATRTSLVHPEMGKAVDVVSDYWMVNSSPQLAERSRARCSQGVGSAATNSYCPAVTINAPCAALPIP